MKYIIIYRKMNKMVNNTARGIKLPTKTPTPPKPTMAEQSPDWNKYNLMYKHRGGKVGRPIKGKAWQEIINQMLSAHDVNIEYTYKRPAGKGYRVIKKIINIDAGQQATVRHLLTAKAVEMAIRQNKLGALTDLLDRDLGKPIQSIDHTTGGERFTDDGEEVNMMLLTILKKAMNKK